MQMMKPMMRASVSFLPDDSARIANPCSGVVAQNSKHFLRRRRCHGATPRPTFMVKVFNARKIPTIAATMTPAIALARTRKAWQAESGDGMLFTVKLLLLGRV